MFFSNTYNIRNFQIAAIDFRLLNCKKKVATKHGEVKVQEKTLEHITAFPDL